MRRACKESARARVYCCMSAVLPPPCPEDLGKYRPQLVMFARTRLFNPSHAEDAVQETLLAAIEGLGSYCGGGSLLGWLKGILKHKIVDCVRRSAREQWQPVDGDGTPACPEDAHSALEGLWGREASNPPEEALHRSKLADALERAMRGMPERTAQVFLMREIVGLSTAEICASLSVSETHCAVMVHRARNRIRERLDPDWMRT